MSGVLDHMLSQDVLPVAREMARRFRAGEIKQSWASFCCEHALYDSAELNDEALNAIAGIVLDGIGVEPVFGHAPQSVECDPDNLPFLGGLFAPGDHVRVVRSSGAVEYDWVVLGYCEHQVVLYNRRQDAYKAPREGLLTAWEAGSFEIGSVHTDGVTKSVQAWILNNGRSA